MNLHSLALFFLPTLSPPAVAADPKAEPQRAAVIVTIAGPVHDCITLMNFSDFGKDWENVDGPLAVEIKRLNRNDGKLPKIAGNLNFYWFGANKHAGVQVGFMETETDRLSKETKQAFALLFAEKKDGKVRKWPESLVCEGTLVQGFNGLGTYGILAARCNTIRLVAEGAKEDVPAPGKIRVTGKAVAGKFKYAEGKEALLAIENGDQPILVIGKAAEAVVGKGEVLRVSGRLQVGEGKAAPLYVEADTVEAVEKK